GGQVANTFNPVSRSRSVMPPQQTVWEAYERCRLSLQKAGCAPHFWRELLRCGVRATRKAHNSPAPDREVGRGSFARSTSRLARDGRRVRFGGCRRHDHPLAERHARRGRRPLLAEVCFLAVLAQVESRELLAHPGLGAERGL